MSAAFYHRPCIPLHTQTKRRQHHGIEADQSRWTVDPASHRAQDGCPGGRLGCPGLAGPGERRAGPDQGRASDADDRISRRAGQLRQDGRAAGGRGDQCSRRRAGPQARRDERGLGESASRFPEGAAHDRAGSRELPHGRDQLGFRADDFAGRRAQQDPLHGLGRTLRCPAQQGLQPLHLPRRHSRDGDGQYRGPGAAARQHGQGQAHLQPDGRLSVRPRPVQGRPRNSSRPTAASRWATSWWRPT